MGETYEANMHHGFDGILLVLWWLRKTTKPCGKCEVPDSPVMIKKKYLLVSWLLDGVIQQTLLSYNTVWRFFGTWSTGWYEPPWPCYHHLRVIQDLENIQRKSSWLLITKHSLVKPFHRKKNPIRNLFSIHHHVGESKLRWLAAHPISHVNLKGAYPYQCQNNPRKSWPYSGIMKPNIVHKSYIA